VRTSKVFLFWLLLCLTPRNSSANLCEVHEVHFQMGTYLEVTVWHEEPDVAKRLIRNAVQEVHRLDTILSNYDPDSALSRLNQYAGAGTLTVPVELYELLARSRDLSAQTRGWFDVTIGPLVKLWQKAAAIKRAPSAGEINQARSLVDYRNLALYQPNAVALIRGGMIIDLGGIGKGYAVDRMTTMLKAAKVTAALVNFGGSSMSAIGAPPRKTAWEIAVQDSDGHLRGAIQLSDLALSTSGSMGHAWIIDGKKYGHLIDPFSGIPVTQERMATVIAANATLAEVLTKPLVLNGSSGLGIVEQYSNVDAVVIPDMGAPAFSRKFRSKSFWRPLQVP